MYTHPGGGREHTRPVHPPPSLLPGTQPAPLSRATVDTAAQRCVLWQGQTPGLKSQKEPGQELLRRQVCQDLSGNSGLDAPGHSGYQDRNDR